MRQISKETVRGTPIRQLKPHPEVSDLDRLIAAAKNQRDKAFAAVLGRDGLRISEAIQLKGGQPTRSLVRL